MLNTTTTRRQHPANKKRSALPEVTKQATRAEALYIFNEFVKDARKEIKKRHTITVKGRVSKTDCDQVTFFAETFSVTIDFTEGITV